jgi:glyoxylase-like metal-dependent hydrolase (beta-lactamase superfamily II)
MKDMQKIAEDVYQISLMPRNSINCCIVEGVLVDAGIRNSYQIISNHLKQIPVHLHVLTHAHADHQGCSSMICNEFNLPLYCHQKEVYRAETGFVTRDYPSSKNIIARFQQKYLAGTGHKVGKTIKENDFVGNFRVIETPGHSDGHISLFREKDGVLVVGDVATNMNLLTTIKGLHLPPSIFTTNKVENVSSLQKLAKLNPRIICFGHGAALVNKNKEFEKFVEKQKAYG